MTRGRIAVIFMLLAFAGIGRGWTITHGVATPPQNLHFPLRTTSVSLPPIDFQRDTIDPRREQDVDEPKVDLFGNEVDDAVGDYRVDVRGDIYERHSPDTEVSRLGPPIS